MRDTLAIECLVQALGDYVDRARECDTERNRFHEGGGTSWGYFGHSVIQRKEQAAEEFQKRLDQYIDEKIKAALSEPR